VKFLDQWCTRTMRSKIEPMKKIAISLRQHRDLILNWFRAKGTVSAGSVEGLNNKAKLTIRKAYGFRTYEAIEIALYHTLGNLPEPNFTMNSVDEAKLNAADVDLEHSVLRIEMTKFKKSRTGAVALDGNTRPCATMPNCDMADGP